MVEVLGCIQRGPIVPVRCLKTQRKTLWAICTRLIPGTEEGLGKRDVPQSTDAQPRNEGLRRDLDGTETAWDTVSHLTVPCFDAGAEAGHRRPCRSDPSSLRHRIALHRMRLTVAASGVLRTRSPEDRRKEVPYRDLGRTRVDLTSTFYVTI